MIIIILLILGLLVLALLLTLDYGFNVDIFRTSMYSCSGNMCILDYTGEYSEETCSGQ